MTDSYHALCIVTQHAELEQLKLYRAHAREFKRFLSKKESRRAAEGAGHTLEGYLTYALDHLPTAVLNVVGLNLEGGVNIRFESLAENLASLWKQSSPRTRISCFEDAQLRLPRANELVRKCFSPMEVVSLMDALKASREPWCTCDSDTEDDV